MKRLKLIPPIVMLSAGAVISITMFIRHYELKTLLTMLLIVLVVFYIVGNMLKKTIETFQAANAENAVSGEGEVIEKEAPEEEEDTAGPQAEERYSAENEE